MVPTTPAPMSGLESEAAEALAAEAELRPAGRATSFDTLDKSPLLPRQHREHGSRRRTGGS